MHCSTAKAMPRNPGEFITNVAPGEDGVWRPSGQSAVSYPDEGHDSCHSVEDDSFWFSHRNDCIAAVIKQCPPPKGLPVADVGGGNGFVARMIQGLGLRTVLIEPGEAGIRHARARGITELVQASLVDLDIVPGALGAVGLFDVIEHIEHDSDVLGALRPMLAEGGRVYVTVPAYSWLWSSVDTEAGHYRRYTVKQLKALFRRNGFQIEYCSYYFWPLPVPMFLLRVLPERWGLRKAALPRTKRVQSEHRHGNAMLKRLLSWETSMLASSRVLFFGASCILVATKLDMPPP